MGTITRANADRQEATILLRIVKHRDVGRIVEASCISRRWCCSHSIATDLSDNATGNQIKAIGAVGDIEAP